MPSPSIAAPRRARRSLANFRVPAAGRTLRAVITGREGDPAWSRPLLWLVGLLAGMLTLWGLTRNGYANSYYAAAAQAASHSWKAWLTNSLDLSGYDSLDKGPLPNMLMGLSGRLLGFSSFSMLLPEALGGVASVLVLHNIVRRTLGHRAAILAALMLALTPIFVAMSRFNNPDALLVLTLICAAWALVRALESGRTRHLALCGLFVGLAFNVKMLEAYLIVPALALTFLIAGRGRLRRRIGQLTAGGAAMFATSFAWYGTMMLLPAADRPWVGDTTDNSWFTLIFGANGLSRVSGSTGGPAGAGGFGGAAGPLRLFNSILGGQIAWLLPLALVGLVLGLWSRRGAARTDLPRSAYLLWGGWAVVSFLVFSFSQGVFHPYYTTALAPAVAVLAAGGLLGLWDRSQRSAPWSAALALAIIGTTVMAALLLGRTAGFLPWLAPSAIALAMLAGAALLLARAMPPWRLLPSRRTIAACAGLAGLLAVIAGPASYSIATVGRSLTGSNPLAGPASAASGFARGPGGGPPSGAGRPAFTGSGRPPGLAGGPPRLAGGLPPAGAGGVAGVPGAGPGTSVARALISYLEAHQGSARYLVAAVGASTSATIALESGRSVINIGGFMGSDPSPSLAQLKHLVETKQLRYVLLSGGQAGGPAGPGGAGGGPGGAGSAAQARDGWIRSHGRSVKISASGAGTASLYELSGTT